MTAGLVLIPGPAQADTHPLDPADPTTPRTAAARPLPTTQINGVVWSQAVIGNTVYVAGEFTTARPAGAAPGVNEVPRSNLLAYDIRTGLLSQTWTPTANAVVNDIEVSPDNSRIYIGGAFTEVNGQTQRRIAALDPTTGNRIASFAPNPNGRVRAIAPTNTSVYFGGNFGAVRGVTRIAFAAARASDGALLEWAPAAGEGFPWDMVLSPDHEQVLLGGSFVSINGSDNPGLGLASVDAVTGASLPWAANSLIRNDGRQQSAITSLETDGDSVYATGATYSRLSRLEGVARMDWDGGDVIWVEDCHGDSLDTFPSGDVVYVASHAHYCGNLADGFPQPDQWNMYRGTAFTKRTTGTLRTEYLNYFNFAGTPAPSMLHWLPNIPAGSYTGNDQGAWAVDGNDDYVVMGGEFPNAGGTQQQGLVRFAKDPSSSISPDETPARLTPTVRSHGAGEALVSWRTSWDRDNENLTYQVVRNENFASPIHTRVVSSSDWDRPYQSFLDTGVTPGSSATYRVVVRDPLGNQIRSNPVTVQVGSSGASDAYARSVAADGPMHYWRFSESSGSTVAGYTGRENGTLAGSPTRGQPGVVPGDASIRFDGTSSQRMANAAAAEGPFWYTVEAWFNTTTNRGGKIVGYGNSQSGTSSSSQSDHALYMDNSGRIIFGSRQGGGNQVLASGSGLNNGQWHQAVGVVTNGGMSLYIDGARTGYRSDVRTGASFNGFWRVGGDNLSGWSSRPSSDYFAGSIDEVAVYGHGLSSSRIRDHYTKSGRALSGAPTDAYGAAVAGDGPSAYWRFAESGGTTAVDSSLSGANGTFLDGAARGATGSGAVGVPTDRTASFDGTNDTVAADGSRTAPDRFSAEAWIKTSSTSGGRIMGFGANRTGTSPRTDRHVYMTDNGRLRFGTAYRGVQSVVETGQPYNDNAWHHVVATQGPLGMRLYVDGVLAGSDPTATNEAFTGYWRVGGDSLAGWASRPSSDYLAGSIDEVAFYDRPLSAGQVGSHYSAGGGQPTNELPQADFTAAIEDLEVQFTDGSDDPDGTIASRSWSFGDGSTSTATNPTHTYSAAGKYVVELTVTDDRGDSDTVSKEVTVTVPVNEPPTAGFTTTVDGLSIDVDGNASDDPDGSVASYAWDWGDGTADGSGATDSHTYAAAGTYTVALTVTDDEGAEDVVTQEVTVAVAVAQDAFQRTVTGGWGTADVGGPWTSAAGVGRLSVAGGRGVVTAGPGQANWAYLNGIAETDVAGTVDLTTDKAPTGGGVYMSVLARRVGNNSYNFRTRFMPDGTVRLWVVREVAGAETQLGAAVLAVPGVSYAPGDVLRLRFEVSGGANATLRATLWETGTPEPAAQVVRTDSTPALAGAGAVGVSTSLSGTATNGPVQMRFDNLDVIPLG
ncbi:PKD domain-containing protein [Nocardioides sp. HDW12B]|uniref:LamG-like jellyroll fold domain-containing protein n=1 Tax=Nocardioides sp. HDW12B TaxID=2714939 RepID=UPI00140DE839|nr:LamG-like jellyroll fold domain-containing protein [Nocardioides sp. HDW12B]QIK65377.1 PKD domain-containing protein [Nocardioides sp. HDW12B]